MGKLRSEYLRIGQLGNIRGIYDNGLYTRGYIKTLPLDVSVDNGSTSTLLGYKVYKKLTETSNLQIELENAEYKLYDVNGKELRLHEILPYELLLGSTSYKVKFLVCSIDIDVIFGQDFLIENVTKIDYRKQTLMKMKYNAGLVDRLM